MVKVSVIITVYNGEMYLRQCLDSVCNQTLKEIEIICVDDGSSDSSYDILKEYQEKDDRFKLYRQQNLYAGVARNTGKAHATGQYMIFWDCDDFFAENALELMYNRAVETQADVCVCGGNQYFEEMGMIFPNLPYMNVKKIPDQPVVNRKTNEAYILNFTNEAAWNKMVRRAFIEEQGISFQPVRNGNDVYFTVNALCLAQRVTGIPDPLVNYRKNQKQSLVGTLSKSPLTPFQAWMDAAANLESKDALPEQSYVNKVIGSMVYLLRNIRQRDVFLSTVAFLQEEGLERLHIRERDSSYYYTPWYAEFVSHIRNDSPEEFESYFKFFTYIQLTERSAENRMKGQELKETKALLRETRKENARLKKELAASQKQCQQLRSSWSYRIGRVIMWLPGIVKRLLG